ncbi:DotA/TraY family protein [Gluconobacter cerinus]|uniref:DotA/TraY family protein n=1 Tax=Gluconobacter cerinus TaxID=38307 RepID=UPI001B8D20B0|nr:DotA/TraY family protein [Gluconobacter cerinus]MBS1038098.1 DotA/TraY family protein [Gluconobacter cerinus]
MKEQHSTEGVNDNFSIRKTIGTTVGVSTGLSSKWYGIFYPIKVVGNIQKDIILGGFNIVSGSFRKQRENIERGERLNITGTERERFLKFKKAYRVSDYEIAQKLKISFFCLIVYFIGIMCSLISAFYLEKNDFVFFLTSISTAILFSSWFFQSYINYCSLRDRKIYSAKSIFKTISLSKISAIVFFPSLFIGMEAKADTINNNLFSMKASNDIYSQFIDKISSTDNLMGVITTDFMSFVFMFSVGIMTYHTIIGIIHTAHAGKVLGDKWHTAFAPARVVLGVATVVPFPVIAHDDVKVVGLGHAIINQIGHLSDNIANTMTHDAFSDALSLGKNSSGMNNQIVPPDYGGMDIVRAFAEKEICGRTIIEFEKYIALEYGQSTLSANLKGKLGSQSEYSNYQLPIVQFQTNNNLSDYGNYSSYTYDYGKCGSISFPADVSTTKADGTTTDPFGAEASTFIDAREKAIEAIVSSFRNTKLITDLVDNQISLAGTNYVLTSNPLLSPPRNSNLKTVKALPTNIAASLKNMATIYNLAIYKASQNFNTAAHKTQYDKILNTVDNKYGWTGLGTFYTTLAAVSDTTANLASNKMNTTDINISYNSDNYYQRDISRYVEITEHAFNSEWVLEVQKGDADISGVELANLNDGGMQETTNQQSGNEYQMSWLTRKAYSGVQSLINSYGRKLQDEVFSFEKSDPQDPLRSETNFGNAIIQISEGAIALSTVLGAISSGLVVWINYATLCVISIGIVHAIIIPMIPAIYMYFAVLSSMLFYTEAMVGIIILAWACVRLDGDELFGQMQKPGLTLLINLLFRQPLYVFFFFATYFIIPPMFSFIDETFATAYIANHSNSISMAGLVSLIGGLAMETYLKLQIALRVFSLITAGPDKVFSWFGASSADGYGAGQHADNFYGMANSTSKQVGNQTAAKAQQEFGHTPKVPGIKMPGAGAGAGADILAQGVNGSNKTGQSTNFSGNDTVNSITQGSNDAGNSSISSPKTSGNGSDKGQEKGQKNQQNEGDTSSGKGPDINI